MSARRKKITIGWTRGSLTPDDAGARASTRSERDAATSARSLQPRSRAVLDVSHTTPVLLRAEQRPLWRAASGIEPVSYASSFQSASPPKAPSTPQPQSTVQHGDLQERRRAFGFYPWALPVPMSPARAAALICGLRQLRRTADGSAGRHITYLARVWGPLWPARPSPHPPTRAVAALGLVIRLQGCCIARRCGRQALSAPVRISISGAVNHRLPLPGGRAGNAFGIYGIITNTIERHSRHLPRPTFDTVSNIAVACKIPMHSPPRGRPNSDPPAHVSNLPSPLVRSRRGARCTSAWTAVRSQLRISGVTCRCVYLPLRALLAAPAPAAAR